MTERPILATDAALFDKLLDAIEGERVEVAGDILLGLSAACAKTLGIEREAWLEIACRQWDLFPPVDAQEDS